MDAEKATRMLRKAAESEELDTMTRKALTAAQWLKETDADDGALVDAIRIHYADLALNKRKTDGTRVEDMRNYIIALVSLLRVHLEPTADHE